MVMETPSPQCVGREFVRQYYTLLHEAPDYLHRFYSHNSSFVHGGVEKPGEEHPPVMGQADIHKKIVSLNFRDCHAKIRQVDSQATVGNAVVVQVTGELSNCGQPMRRFMQTFVLAPQSPKKYYVHNDIFRYQDEVFNDSDGDGDAPEEATGTSYVDSDADLMEEDPASNGAGDQVVAEPTSVSTYYDDMAAQPTLSNGDAHLEEVGETVEEVNDKDMMQPEASMDEEELAAAPDTTEPVSDMFTTNIVEEKEKSPEPEPQEESQPEVVKPHSWASIISSGGKGSSVSVPTSAVQQPSAPICQPAKQQSSGPAPVSGGKQEFNKADVGGQGPQPQRAPRPPRTDRPRERDNSRGGGTENDENRLRSRFPDSHQLFVGNLPHSISEKELKSFFEQFGTVVDVRINRKSAPRDVPNFGFVVFDNPESVQQVLEQKPIIINNDHRLNVEEKKQRSEQGARPGSGTRAGGGGRGSGGPPGRSGSGPMGGMSRGGGRGGAPMTRSAPDSRSAVGGPNRGPRR